MKYVRETEYSTDQASKHNLHIEHCTDNLLGSWGFTSYSAQMGAIMAHTCNVTYFCFCEYSSLQGS